MNRLILAASVLALVGNAVSQSSFSSPSGFLTTEGKSAAYIFGEYQSPRVMMFDGEMRNKVIVMNEVGFRHDNRSYQSNNGAARSWSNITLDVSYCNYAKADTTFTLNPTSTPSRVFSSSMSWPGILGYPKTKPAPFTPIKFPFSSIWLYNGAEDICLDWDFQGGTLANGTAWGSFDYYRTYYLDSAVAGTTATGQYTTYGTGCSDSGTATNPATTWVYTNVYNNNYASTSSYRNMYRVYTQTRYTAKGKPLVVAMTIGGNKLGVNFPGVSCEKVFINLAGPMLLVPLLAGTGSDARVYMPRPGLLFPYQASLAGLAFWAQSAWDDSVTGQLKLSQAEESLLPLMPPIYKRQTIFQTDPAKKTVISQGFAKATESTHNPILRYGQ